MHKLTRQKAILETVRKRPVRNQYDLGRQLARHGLRVTQATLSRDLREMGLVKTPEGYLLPGAWQHAEPLLPSFAHLAREFVTDVREAQNLLVLKTTVGSAQPVAAALDSESWPEVVGTVGGDDTILVVSPDKHSAHQAALRIRETLA